MSILEAALHTARVLLPLAIIGIVFITGYILGSIDVIDSILGRSKK